MLRWALCALQHVALASAQFRTPREAGDVLAPGLNPIFKLRSQQRVEWRVSDPEYNMSIWARKGAGPEKVKLIYELNSNEVITACKTGTEKGVTWIDWPVSQYDVELAKARTFYFQIDAIPSGEQLFRSADFNITDPNEPSVVTSLVTSVMTSVSGNKTSTVGGITSNSTMTRTSSTSITPTSTSQNPTPTATDDNTNPGGGITITIKVVIVVVVVVVPAGLVAPLIWFYIQRRKKNKRDSDSKSSAGSSSLEDNTFKAELDAPIIPIKQLYGPAEMDAREGPNRYSRAELPVPPPPLSMREFKRAEMPGNWWAPRRWTMTGRAELAG